MNNLFSRKLFFKITRIWVLSLFLLGSVSTVVGQKSIPDEITCGTQLNDSNSNAANDYTKTFYNSSNCNLNFSSGFNGKDVQYILDIPQSGKVTIQLYNLTNDLDLFLYRMNNNGNPTSCAAAPSTKSNRSAEKITATLNPGKYLVMIDAYASNIVSNYTLRVDCDIDSQDCCDNVLNKSWIKNVIKNICEHDCKGQKIYCATYNGQPAIHITPWTTCTDGIGYVYDCNGNELGRYGGFAGWRLSGTLRDIKLLWTTAECEETPGSECTSTPTNCYEVDCIPGTPRTTENGNYACTIDCTYKGDKSVRYWKVNNRRINTPSKSLGYTVDNPGTYTVCVYFECDGRIYECCSEVECPPTQEEDCTSTPTNCEEVSCTPRTPRTTESGNYSCRIDCSYKGDKRVRYWEVNGQRVNTTSKNPSFTATRPGTYTICVYFECDGRIYKCCREVECPPIGGDCCSEDLLTKNWIKNFMEDFCESDCTGQEIWCATYNGRPAIHITPSTTCTDQNGYVYDCNGNELDKYGYWVGGLSGTLIDTRLLWSTDECETQECQLFDDFEGYANGANISTRNPNLWKKWSNSARDGRTSRDRAQSGSQSMEINRNQFGEQDIVFRLGNKSNGKYKVAWDMYINRNDRAYFNIQNSESNLKPKGVVYFEYNDRDYNYQGKWMKVELYIDLDNNKLSMYFDNRQVAGGNYTANLGGINFYAVDDAHFYIDNMCLQKVTSIPFTNNDSADSRNSVGLNLSIDNASEKEFSESTNATLQGTDKMTVYPNPSKGITTIKLDLESAKAVQLTVFNQTGQLVRTIDLGTTQHIQEQLNLSDLPDGLYYLNVNGADLSLSKRFVIQK